MYMYTYMPRATTSQQIKVDVLKNVTAYKSHNRTSPSVKYSQTNLVNRIQITNFQIRIELALLKKYLHYISCSNKHLRYRLERLFPIFILCHAVVHRFKFRCIYCSLPFQDHNYKGIHKNLVLMLSTSSHHPK